MLVRLLVVFSPLKTACGVVLSGAASGRAASGGAASSGAASGGVASGGAVLSTKWGIKVLY